MLYNLIVLSIHKYMYCPFFPKSHGFICLCKFSLNSILQIILSPQQTFPQLTRLTNTDVDKVLKNKIRMKSSLRKNRRKTHERPKEEHIRMGSRNIAHINVWALGKWNLKH